MLEKIFSLIIPKRVFKTLFGPNAPSCETSCQFSNHKCVFGGHNYNFQSDHRTVDWTDRDLVRIILTQNWRDTLSPDFLGRTKRKKKYYYRIIRDHWLNSLSQHFHCKPLVNVVTAFQNQKPKNNHRGHLLFDGFASSFLRKKLPVSNSCSFSEDYHAHPHIETFTKQHTSITPLFPFTYKSCIIPLKPINIKEKSSTAITGFSNVEKPYERVQWPVVMN